MMLRWCAAKDTAQRVSPNIHAQSAHLRHSTIEPTFTPTNRQTATLSYAYRFVFRTACRCSQHHLRARRSANTKREQTSRFHIPFPALSATFIFMLCHIDPPRQESDRPECPQVIRTNAAPEAISEDAKHACSAPQTEPNVAATLHKGGIMFREVRQAMGR